MTEGLFDRYFRLLAGTLPAAEYGVIAEETDVSIPTTVVSGADSTPDPRGRLCRAA